VSSRENEDGRARKGEKRAGASSACSCERSSSSGAAHSARCAGHALLMRRHARAHRAYALCRRGSRQWPSYANALACENAGNAMAAFVQVCHTSGTNRIGGVEVGYSRRASRRGGGGGGVGVGIAEWHEEEYGRGGRNSGNSRGASPARKPWLIQRAGYYVYCRLSS